MNAEGGDAPGSSAAPAPTLTIAAGSHTFLVAAGDPFTFGRSPSCTVALDSTDRSISRIAGRVEFVDRSWVLVNTSTSRPLYTVDDIGLRRTLAVGSSELLKDGVTRIVVFGTRTHEIVAHLAAPGASGCPVESNLGANAADRTFLPSITANERVAIAAIAEGYLLPHPRHDPRPRTYAEAGCRVGMPGSVIRKRVENVRKKLLDAGVFQVESADARAAVVEFALAVRLVTTDDLSVLPADGDGNEEAGDCAGE